MTGSLKINFKESKNVHKMSKDLNSEKRSFSDHSILKVGSRSKGVLCSSRTDRLKDTKVKTGDSFSGFQEFSFKLSSRSIPKTMVL